MSVSRPIGWGIVGAGHVATGFAAAITVVDGTHLSAVTARTPDRAKALAERHGAARVHPNIESLATDENVDVVYVATPNHRHADDVIACLEFGKPVLCEKPFTVNLAEARAVVETARRTGLFCMEAMWMRFIPAIRRAAELIHGGELGEIRTMYADFSIAASRDPASRLFDPLQGGGALLDLGVYPLSLAQLALGEPSEITARLSIGPTGVDEHATVVASYPSGALATLTASIRSRGPNTCVIAGSNGGIRLPGPICAPRWLQVEPFSELNPSEGAGSSRRRLGGAVDPVRRFVSRHPLLERTARFGLAARRRMSGAGPQTYRFPFDLNGYEYQIREVISRLQEGAGESPTMPLDQSLRVIELIDTIRSEHGLV